MKAMCTRCTMVGFVALTLHIHPKDLSRGEGDLETYFQVVPPRLGDAIDGRKEACTRGVMAEQSLRLTRRNETY